MCVSRERFPLTFWSQNPRNLSIMVGGSVASSPRIHVCVFSALDRFSSFANRTWVFLQFTDSLTQLYRSKKPDGFSLAWANSANFLITENWRRVKNKMVVDPLGQFRLQCPHCIILQRCKRITVISGMPSDKSIFSILKRSFAQTKAREPVNYETVFDPKS